MTKNNEYEDTAYYIVNLEHASYEDSLLFWKPKQCGYTPNLDEAGVYSKEFADDMNLRGRDIALTKTELFSLGAKSLKLVRFSILDLKDIKQEMKAPNQRNSTRDKPIKNSKSTEEKPDPVSTGEK